MKKNYLLEQSFPVIIMMLLIHVLDNSDKNDSIKTLQPTLPLIQTTLPPLIGLSNSDPLYISSILLGSKFITSRMINYC